MNWLPQNKNDRNRPQHWVVCLKKEGIPDDLEAEGTCWTYANDNLKENENTILFMLIAKKFNGLEG